jgi:predicted TIM-barrel fold metal-dependent hydrolase
MDLPLSDYRKMAVAEFDTTKLLAHAAQQAKERGYERFPIVDVDSHHYESESMMEILDYIDDPVLHQLMLSAGQANAKNNGVLPTGVGYQDIGGRVMRYPLRKMEKTDGSEHRDIALTKRWMDCMGTDIAILFPTPMLQLGVHPQVEVEVALARAYNRWLCEKVLAKEPRLRSMLYLPFNDAEATFRMVQEFGKHEGVCGFMVTAARYRPVHHNSYMKTYALLEDLNLPIGFHAAYNWNDQSMSMLNRFISVHALGFTFHNMVHMANWIVNGIPERFPKLKVVWIESGLAWIPFMMQRFDNEYLMRTSEAPALKKLPSDYMRDMYWASQPMEMTDMGLLQETMRVINADTQLVYSSDYPHWDFDLPSTISDLPFLSEKGKHNILGGTAARLFKLPPRNETQKENLKKFGNLTAAA